MKFVALIIAALTLTACALQPQHDPVTVLAVAQESRVVVIRADYTAAATRIDKLLVTGQITKADAISLRNELQGKVRPLVESAQRSIGTASFAANATAAESALRELELRTTATPPPTTLPTLPLPSTPALSPLDAETPRMDEPQTPFVRYRA